MGQVLFPEPRRGTHSPSEPQTGLGVQPHDGKRPPAAPLVPDGATARLCSMSPCSSTCAMRRRGLIAPSLLSSSLRFRAALSSVCSFSHHKSPTHRVSRGGKAPLPARRTHLPLAPLPTAICGRRAVSGDEPLPSQQPSRPQHRVLGSAMIAAIAAPTAAQRREPPCKAAAPRASFEPGHHSAVCPKDTEELGEEGALPRLPHSRFILGLSGSLSPQRMCAAESGIRWP